MAGTTGTRQDRARGRARTGGLTTLARPVVLASLVLATLAATVAVPSPATGASSRRATASAETASDWIGAFNRWQGEHGRRARIVASVDHGTRDGVHYLEVEIAQPAHGGSARTCGWLAIHVQRLGDPQRQIAGGGPVDCTDLKGLA